MKKGSLDTMVGGVSMWVVTKKSWVWIMESNRTHKL